MRPLALTLSLSASLLLGACVHDRGRFVKPVATPVAADAVDADAARFEDGYLRVFVSSNLDANGRALDFGKETERPAMLLISARFGKGTVASFAADADPEIPVLLYDVQAGKTVSSVVDNALLSEGLLVDPESLSKSPHLQIVVRGVPGDKARWVTHLLQLATSEPILKIGLNFAPGGAAVSALSTRLGELLSEEIKTSNKPWEEKTLLGLRADQGLSALDGRQFVVLLNSTDATALQAPSPDLRRCEAGRSPTGLCELGGAPWTPAAAYVRFELDVSDYRSVKDFIGTALSCEADEGSWSGYRALIGSGQLARKQTQYERQLLARGELLLSIRRASADSSSPPWAGRLLHYAQQAALLPTPGDAYWVAHFRDSAKALDACVRLAALRGQSRYATLWDQAYALYARAPAYASWTTALTDQASAESPALQDAERELAATNRLLALEEVRGLDRQSLDSLGGLATQLQLMLRPAYERIARRLLDAVEPAASGPQQLERLAAETACTECAAALRVAAGELRVRLMPPPAPVEAAAPVAPAPELAPPG
ncbi:MAG: hypothetical protein Q8Q73_16725 [Stagnimonas sp.]|nr:hypothetical protein [Stagnimonas sp.]